MATVYDHREIIRLRKAGYTHKQIAKAVGCGTDTVSKVLTKAGMRVYIAKAGEFKTPILLEEIDRYRESLQIGEVLWLTRRDEWNQSVKIDEKYKITAKYRWFCIARNGRGQEQSVPYVDLIIRERGKTST